MGRALLFGFLMLGAIAALLFVLGLVLFVVYLLVGGALAVFG